MGIIPEYESAAERCESYAEEKGETGSIKADALTDPEVAFLCDLLNAMIGEGPQAARHTLEFFQVDYVRDLLRAGDPELPLARSILAKIST